MLVDNSFSHGLPNPSSYPRECSMWLSGSAISRAKLWPATWMDEWLFSHETDNYTASTSESGDAGVFPSSFTNSQSRFLTFCTRRKILGQAISIGWYLVCDGSISKRECRAESSAAGAKLKSQRTRVELKPRVSCKLTYVTQKLSPSTRQTT